MSKAWAFHRNELGMISGAEATDLHLFAGTFAADSDESLSLGLCPRCLGCPTGLEPVASGITIRRSTN